MAVITERLVRAEVRRFRLRIVKTRQRLRNTRAEVRCIFSLTRRFSEVRVVQKKYEPLQRFATSQLRETAEAVPKMQEAL